MLPEPMLTRDDARGLWIVDAEMVVPSRGFTLIIPKGFETDLASVPRVFWPLIAPFELSCVAPIVHDFIYEHGGRITTRVQGIAIKSEYVHVFTKSQADLFLLDLMQQEGISRWRRYAAYYAVSCFGGSSWQSKAVPPSPESSS